MRQLVVAAVMLVGIEANAAVPPEAPNRLSAVRQRGFLGCGIGPTVAGFSFVDDRGEHAGIDVDICRAVAIAIFGKDATRFIPVDTIEDFLSSSDLDIASRRLTWSIRREQTLGIRFGPVMFHDGQGFLVANDSGIASIGELSGKTICVEEKSEADSNLLPALGRHGISVRPGAVPPGKSEMALRRGDCAAYSADISLLADYRSRMSEPAAFQILPERVTEEPLAQMVREQDGALLSILELTVYALIEAEELGITSENAIDLQQTGDIAVQRFFTHAGTAGRASGLAEDWVVRVISLCGNYGQIYDRNLGMSSSIKLPRGINDLWFRGGLLFAPAMG